MKGKTKPRSDAPEWVFNTDFLRQLTRKYARGNRAQVHVCALYLYYLCGMKQEDIAEQFGLTEGGVEKMIQRLVHRAEKYVEKNPQYQSKGLSEKPVPYSTVSEGEIPKEMVIVAVPPQFVWAPADLTPIAIDLSGEQPIDFGRIAEGSNRFEPVLYGYPNDFLGYVGPGEAVRYRLQAFAGGREVGPSSVYEVAWNGAWSDNLDRMEQNLTIRRVG